MRFRRGHDGANVTSQVLPLGALGMKPGRIGRIVPPPGVVTSVVRTVAGYDCVLCVVLLTKQREKDMNVVWFLIVGLVAGWLAGMLVKGGGFGLIGDLVVGVIGAVLGGWLFNAFGASAGGGILGSIIVATIGAVVLLVIVRMIKRA